ncbi:hypothetical protein M9H77_15740 [Catharanthus roseus]|uniref:Uncharacterized protein n=1 Tax=Catharanthus roseus TaxID=4058 RepID=A0ACC0AZJ5_CATRO|nr:hypothetical protein M9H77_15740 [Catharanthus roseus]
MASSSFSISVVILMLLSILSKPTVLDARNNLVITNQISPKHFVLVHGACHGAWCWYKLVSLLESGGHKVTALDLGASGRNEVPLDDLKTIDDYHKPLYSYLESLPSDEKVILVGHSMGGYAVSSAMERYPNKISLAVFAAAFMIGPNLTLSQITTRLGVEADAYGYGDSTYTTSNSSGNGVPETILFGPKYMIAKLYNMSPREDYVLANLSTRFAKFFNDDESIRQRIVTKEKYGKVRRAYIVSGEDKGLRTDIQKWMVANNPPDEVKEINGADHMLMFSKPHQLSSILEQLAKKYL